MKIAQVREGFKKHLIDLFSHSGCSSKELKELSGEVHLNVIRGKPKIGYDLNYEILFENEEGEEGVLKVTEQMDDDNEG